MSEHSPLATHHLPLFLVGYRGSGKSTVAKMLSVRLGWQWLDADEVLEQRQGRSIRQIFAEDGEPAFRDMESAILAELCVLKRHVIATGGGIVLREENRQRLKIGGIVAWLTADAATLWARMQQDITTAERRPDLSTGGLAEIESLLRIREPWYAECAHFVVKSVGRSPEYVADDILKCLEGAGRWCTTG